MDTTMKKKKTIRRVKRAKKTASKNTPLLDDSAWRERTGFDNICTIEDHLDDMEPEKLYRTMDRLDAIGYYSPENE